MLSAILSSDFAQILGLVTLLFGGAWAFFKFVVQHRQTSISEHLTRLEKEIKRLEEGHKDCERRNEELAKKLDDLQLMLWTQERLEGKIPIPHWVKDFHGRFRYVSPSAMLDIFAPLGLGKDDILGFTTEEVFGEDMAELFRELERSALMSSDKKACSHNVQITPTIPKQNIYEYVQDSIFKDGTVMYFGACVPV